VHRDRSHRFESMCVCVYVNVFCPSVGINMLINLTRVSDRKESGTALAKAVDEKLVQHV